MRRANGTGSVFKLSGKRHKPWCAKVVVGWKDSGQPIYKYIGYYKTKTEGINALAAYSVAPDTVLRISLEDAWVKWSASYTGRSTTLAAYASAYKRMKPWHHITLDRLTLDMMQSMCDLAPVTYARAINIKKTLSAILDWGQAHDYCPSSRKDLLKYLRLPERPVETSARILTDDEIHKALETHQIGPVILLFTGLRMGELTSLEPGCINWEDLYIDVRHSKTKAGIRHVPIPDGLVPWLKEYEEAGGIGRGRKYFEAHFWPADCGYRRHDCRHTYITLLTEAGVDARMIKALVGHTGDVTTDVYTHWSMERKKEIVNNAFEYWFPKFANSHEGMDRLLA